MRFSFKIEGRVTYSDIVATISLVLTIIGILL